MVASHNAAVAAMGRYDYAAAFDTLQPLAKDHPQWLDGQVDLSIAQLNRQQEGDEQEALDRLENVLTGAPEHLRANYVKGLLLMNAGKSEAALACFKRVVTADPADGYAAYYTGQAQVQLGRFEAAVPWFTTAIAVDPYLRSSYYAGAQAARRSGNASLADAWLETFQRMEHNPRAVLAELKYTRMGPKAEVQAIAIDTPRPMSRPAGPVFDQSISAIKGCDDCPPYEGISVARIGDRTLVLCPTEANCDLMVLGEDWQLDCTMEHTREDASFAWVTMVRGALWGDIDADGHVDVVLLRNGINELWLGREDLIFEKDDRFDGGAATETVDGALFDADHDGDLDALFLQGDGRLQLVNNNGDGSWQDITGRAFGASAQSANGVEGRQLVVADLDGDLDTDVLCIDQSPPHRVWVNDRLWNWRVGDVAWSSVISAPIAAAVAADFDSDGAMELVAMDDDAALYVWDVSSDGWSSRLLAPAVIKPEPFSAKRTITRGLGRPRQLAVADFTGDGHLDVLRQTQWVVKDHVGQPPVMEVVSNVGQQLQIFVGQKHGTLVDGHVGEGPGHIAAGDIGMIITTPPGPGRFPFVDIDLAGRVDPGQTMRSNVSGIGTTLAARVGGRWTITGAVRNTAGPGQNLQGVSIGLGGAEAIDFVAIDWTDGVYQTEANLRPGEVHTIVETQRQLSSCPVLFGWDGERMSFITDCLGVGGVGFLLKPGTYVEPRPWERVLLPEGALQPRNGMLDMVIAEPMQETCYLDDVTMLTVDLPEGWEVLPDERMGTGGVSPTGELFFSQHTMSPYAVHTIDHRDITAEITQADGIAADPGPVHTRFIGSTVEPFDFAAFFEEDFDVHEGTPLLVLDAWVEYPYAQTMFAAWQAGVTYEPLSIEVQVNGNLWVRVAEHVGYPAGMPRTMVLPLPNLPAGAKNIRLRTTLECYIDNLRIAWAHDCSEAIVHGARPARAELFEAGYPRRTDGPHRRPHYDWRVREPFWDTRTQRGLYTAMGDVSGLVSDRDGAIAVFGVGEAVSVAFPAQDPPAEGLHRRYVLDLGGWAKDMDFMTRTGATVAPLPGDRDAAGAELQQATQTRYRDGR